MRLLIILSGPIGVGKSSVGKQLEELSRAHRVSTRSWLIQHAGADNERGSLQAAGERMDEETRGAWVVNAAEEAERDLPADAILLVDSARTTAQVEKLRERFGERVFHVHLHAADEMLERRYRDRHPELREFGTYSEARRNGTEACPSSGDLRQPVQLRSGGTGPSRG